MRLLLNLFFIMIFWSNSVLASVDIYKKYFEVDLDAPVPDLDALSKELEKANEIYNPRYMVNWDMGPAFDKIFKGTIFFRHIRKTY